MKFMIILKSRVHQLFLFDESVISMLMTDVGFEMCWCHQLGDNFKILATVLVTNIHYPFTLVSGTNTQKM